MALGEFLSHHIEKEHFGIRRSLRRVASDYVAPAYRVVARNVRRYEKKALDSTLAPPRVLSLSLEALMTYQAVTGGVDPYTFKIWSISKFVGWSIPLTCATIPETRSRKFVGGVLSQMWSNPGLLYDDILDGLSEQAYPKIKNMMIRAWNNPGDLVDEAMDLLADGVVSTTQVGLKVAEASTLFAVRTGYRAIEKSADIAVRVAQKSGDEFTLGVRRIVEGVAPLHLNYAPVYLEIPEDGFEF